MCNLSMLRRVCNMDVSLHTLNNIPRIIIEIHGMHHIEYYVIPVMSIELKIMHHCHDYHSQ